jgi:hypothetical protein
MTQTVLPQLQEISDDLLAQEKALTAQLAEVQEKLRGVRAILPLFGEISSGLKESDEEYEDDEDDSYDEAPAESLRPSTAKAGKATKAKAGKAAASKTAVKAEKKPKAAAEKSTERSAEKSAGAKAAAKKKDGRAASWQKYTRPGVKETSIPEAVRLVLETQPDKSFKIAEVMDALFNETMPKSQHLKARNRISNVLSGGVRSGEWFKGDRGTYRLSSD